LFSEGFFPTNLDKAGGKIETPTILITIIEESAT
jgi:hypothetical protein